MRINKGDVRVFKTGNPLSDGSLAYSKAKCIETDKDGAVFQMIDDERDMKKFSLAVLNLAEIGVIEMIW